MVASTEHNEDYLRADFLESLTEYGNVTAACRKANLPRRTAYEWRRTDEAFAKAWDEALEIGVDALEDEATRRAQKGVKRPVYQGGECVGYVRDYSDTLLIFLLKGRRPWKYRERYEVSGDPRAPLTMKVEAKVTHEPDRDAFREFLTGLAGAGRQPGGLASLPDVPEDGERESVDT